MHKVQICTQARESDCLLLDGHHLRMPPSNVDIIYNAFKDIEAQLLSTLVQWYKVDAVSCARFCDVVLDDSGALLGRVRDQVNPPEQRTDRSPWPSDAWTQDDRPPGPPRSDGELHD